MSERMRTGSRHWLVIGAPALLAALLCAYRLGDRSLWLDEGASVAIAAQHGGALWHGIAHDGGNMLAYYLALHGIIALFGDSAVALRMLSLLADAATAGLVTALALRLGGTRAVALGAGLLTAVNVALLFWGQDARGYSLMVTATTASFYALVLLLNSDAGRRPPAAVLGAYVLATALALYIGFDAALVIPAQLLIAFLLRRRLAVLIAALGVVLALCVPLAVLAIHRGSGQLFWVPPLSAGILSQTLVTLFGAGLPPNFHVSVLTVAATVLAAALTLWALGGALGSTVLRVRRARSDERVGVALLASPWLVLTAVIAVLGAAVGEPFELARIAILLMPALAILLAAALVGEREPYRELGGVLPEPGVRAVRAGGARPVIGIGLLVVLLGLRLAALAASYGATPEPWKQVTARVLAAAGAGDCVAFYPEDGHMPFGYYVQQDTAGAARTALRSVLPREPWSRLRPEVERYAVPAAPALAAQTVGCRRVWLIASHQGQAHGTAQSRRNWAGYGTIQRELAALYGPADRRRYGWAATISVLRYTRR